MLFGAFVVCGLWFVVCGLWFVVCGLWFVVKIRNITNYRKLRTQLRWKKNVTYDDITN